MTDIPTPPHADAPPGPPLADFMERILEARKYRLVQHFSRHILADLSIEMQTELFGHLADDMLLTLQAELYGERTRTADVEKTIDYPATWWQMFKRDHMPAWYRNRYPVRQTTCKVRLRADEWRMYPHPDLPLPASKYGKSVRVLDTSHSVRWDGTQS